MPLSHRREVLVVTGLCLDVVGVVLLYFFGLARAKPESGMTISYSDPEGLSKEEAARKLLIRKTMSYSGLGLLVSGFLLQLVGNL